MMILTPIILLNTLTGISGKQYFTATNQTRILLKADVAAAIMNIFINFLLIPQYGYVGAAIATVCGECVGGLLITQYYYLKKQVNIRNLCCYSIKYLVGALIMAFCIFLFTRKMHASPLTTFLQILIGAATYFIYLLVIKDSLISEIVSVLKNGVFRINK